LPIDELLIHPRPLIERHASRRQQVVLSTNQMANAVVSCARMFTFTYTKRHVFRSARLDKVRRQSLPDLEGHARIQQGTAKHTEESLDDE
jgi:hypothetical protein